MCLVLALAAPAVANTLPVASNASTTVLPGGSVSVTLAATDADSDALEYIITALPAEGSVIVGATTLASGDLPYTIPASGKTFTFTATSTDHGDELIKFKANDGTGDSTVATITVRVNLAPAASATTTFFTMPSTDLKITLPATDPDADTMTYSITSLPGHGRLLNGTTALTDQDIPCAMTKNTITYSPDTAYHGRDLFAFTATDGYATSPSIEATIEVNTTPVPNAVSTTVLPDGTRTIALTSTDADRDPVVYAILSLPAHGTLTVGSDTLASSDLPIVLGTGVTTVTYAVEAGYRGTDSFHYRVQDAVSQSGRAVVAIVVNIPPVAPSLAMTVTGRADALLLPTDADGDALTARITRLPVGTLTVGGKAATKTDTVYTVPSGGLAFSYTPPSGTATTDTFEWTASDGRDSSPAAVVTLIIHAGPPPATTQPTTPDTTTPTDTQPSSEPETPSDTTGAACGPMGATGPVLAAIMVQWLFICGRRRSTRARKPV